MTLSLIGRVSLGTFELACNLEIDSGVLGVEGVNGIGKTTLLRVIAGLTPLRDGALKVDGVVYDDPSSGIFVPAHKRQVGMVFQDHSLLPYLSVFDNIVFAHRHRGGARGAARGDATQILQIFGAQDFSALMPDSLSGGQAQRACLARAFVGNPKIVLLDEPLSAIDQGSRSELRRIIRESLAAVDGYKIVVSHDKQDIAELCVSNYFV